MESLIDDTTFGECSMDIDELLAECKQDYEEDNAVCFVGICLSECDAGLVIKARNSCVDHDQLMTALQGAINLYFAEHPQEDEK